MKSGEKMLFLGILIFFPQITLFLPDLMFGKG